MPSKLELQKLANQHLDIYILGVYLVLLYRFYIIYLLKYIWIIFTSFTRSKQNNVWKMVIWTL